MEDSPMMQNVKLNASPFPTGNSVGSPPGYNEIHPGGHPPQPYVPQPAANPSLPYPPQPGYPPQYGYSPQHGYPPQPMNHAPQQMYDPQLQQGYYPVPQSAPHHVPQSAPHHVPQSASPAPVAAPDTTVVYAQQLGPRPSRVTCSACHQQTVTWTESKTSSKAHIMALILCVIGCWPCCLIPYCVDDCMNYTHYCTNCNAYIGRYDS